MNDFVEIYEILTKGRKNGAVIHKNRNFNVQYTEMCEPTNYPCKAANKRPPKRTSRSEVQIER